MDDEFQLLGITPEDWVQTSDSVCTGLLTLLDMVKDLTMRGRALQVYYDGLPPWAAHPASTVEASSGRWRNQADERQCTQPARLAASATQQRVATDWLNRRDFGILVR